MLTSDDADVRVYVVATLGWLGYFGLEVARAPKMLSATWMSMKVSVSDVVMPGMNGRKMNRQQKALSREFRSATWPGPLASLVTRRCTRSASS